MKKVLTLTQVRKRVDRNFSRYTRLVNSDMWGMCTCISCGKDGKFDEMDAGHFVNRKVYRLRYEFINVNVQCKYCNRYLEGNPAGYSVGIINQYGIDGLTYLNTEMKLKHTHTVENLLELNKWLLSEIKKEENKRLLHTVN